MFSLVLPCLSGKPDLPSSGAGVMPLSAQESHPSSVNRRVAPWCRPGGKRDESPRATEQRVGEVQATDVVQESDGDFEVITHGP